jgi:cyclase
VTETIEAVADGVWVGIPGPGEGAMAALVDSGKMLVLDTTSYNVWAEKFVAHVAEAESCRGPSLLYISHRHFDHFAGADAIDVPVIGHWLTRAVMARYTQEWMDRNIEEWTRLEMVVPELLRDPTVVLPQILFDTDMDVEVGSSVAQLMHVGGHCTDQTVAYLPKQRVLFASDNIIHEKPVYTGDGDLFTWIEALRKLQKLPIEVVIPGHGSVGGPELIDAKIAYLEELLEEKLRGHT